MASNHESIRAKKPKEEELIQEFSLGQEKSPPLFPHFLSSDMNEASGSAQTIQEQIFVRPSHIPEWSD